MEMCFLAQGILTVIGHLSFYNAAVLRNVFLKKSISAHDNVERYYGQLRITVCLIEVKGIFYVTEGNSTNVHNFFFLLAETP